MAVGGKLRTAVNINISVSVLVELPVTTILIDKEQHL